MGDEMAYIPVPEGLPGIRGLLAFSPETAAPMGELAEVLLRGPNSLSRADRELVGAYVSRLNGCQYCASCHGAIAAEHAGGTEADYAVVGAVEADAEHAPISAKMKALLAVAAHVQQSGRAVTTADIERARREGATDREIHDVVLIAAAFCMFNRYVDGLGTWQPDDPAFYREAGRHTADLGYVNRRYAPVTK
jgi:uncharacterized peroxidase-related enzyme